MLTMATEGWGEFGMYEIIKDLAPIIGAHGVFVTALGALFFLGRWMGGLASSVSGIEKGVDNVHKDLRDFTRSNADQHGDLRNDQREIRREVQTHTTQIAVINATCDVIKGQTNGLTQKKQHKNPKEKEHAA